MGRASKRALGPDIVDACLLEAHPGAKPAQELVGLGKREQLVHDPPVHQREVARVERHGNVERPRKTR